MGENDSILFPADSIAEDTVLSVAPREEIAVTLPEAEIARIEPVAPASYGMSWVVAALIFLFLIISLRYRKNSRYFSLILQDATEIRERHNAFDDTLRETAFVWLLNLLWCASAGFLLYGLLFRPEFGMQISGEGITRLGLCMGMALGYTIFLSVAYRVVGAVFSDPAKASLWVKGYLSSQGLEAILLFPLAMLGMCVPGLLFPMVVCGGIIFVLVKLLFIYKGFCIFFTETASWVLFLYYLCSLEIVPVVLTYAGAAYLCSL